MYSIPEFKTHVYDSGWIPESKKRIRVFESTWILESKIQIFITYWLVSHSSSTGIRILLNLRFQKPKPSSKICIGIGKNTRIWKTKLQYAHRTKLTCQATSNGTPNDMVNKYSIPVGYHGPKSKSLSNSCIRLRFECWHRKHAVIQNMNQYRIPVFDSGRVLESKGIEYWYSIPVDY